MSGIVLTGGSGFIGKALYDYFTAKGEKVVIVSRHQPDWIAKEYFSRWDGKTYGDWAKHLEGAKAVINLSGKSVDCRYTNRNRELILSSRTDATNAIAAAIAQCQTPPEMWLNAASATIYRHAEDRPQTETNGEIGHGFSVDVCKAWEKSFFESRVQIRKAALRISIVLGKGSALNVLKGLTMAGLGGAMGNGHQMFSWVHVDDLCRSIDYIITHKIEGPVNIASPGSVTNREFMGTLREKLGIPFGIPQPAWLIKMGAVLLRTEAELVLKSRWVAPEKLSKAGFEFRYKEIGSALSSLV